MRINNENLGFKNEISLTFPYSPFAPISPLFFLTISLIFPSTKHAVGVGGRSGGGLGRGKPVPHVPRNLYEIYEV